MYLNSCNCILLSEKWDQVKKRGAAGNLELKRGTVSLKVGQLETMITVNNLLLHGLVFAFGNVKLRSCSLLIM